MLSLVSQTPICINRGLPYQPIVAIKPPTTVTSRIEEQVGLNLWVKTSLFLSFCKICFTIETASFVPIEM